MTEDDICGYVKNDGEECTFSPKYSDGRCGHHTDVDGGSSGPTSRLEENPEVIELMAEEIRQGATVLEALAEVEEKTGVYISESTHRNWMQRGKSDTKQTLYKDYRTGVMRARNNAAKSERRKLMQECIENGDTRTLHKIHKEMYGDLYDNDTSGETVAAPFAIPEDLMKEWQQQETSPQ